MQLAFAKQSGFTTPAIVALAFSLATALGAVFLPYDEDASPCEWFGTWNGAGFGGYQCAGHCTADCKVELSQVVENTFWCWCPDGGNLVNCFGGAQTPGGVVSGVTSYESPSGCNTSGHRCIPPNHSQGWNGQIGLGYRMCQCLQP